ncbi:MAG: DAK2 domain-containing protein, partial [Halanaerobiaceae bacterium]
MQADNKSKEYIVEIDGRKLKKSFISALNSLKEKKDLVDSLNVFPVPDGDTGTNMYLTLLEGVKKIKSSNSGRVDEITALLSQGALMGARGNSGVILSQLLRGFAEVNQGEKYMNAENLAKSLKKASEIAYHGVMKPVEGTILTVSRGAARGAKNALTEDRDFIEVLEMVVDEAEKTLNKTPEKLPDLKEAGVVDAGGKGYLIILRGMLQGLLKNDNEKTEVIISEEKKTDNLQKDIKYIYDTQILVDLKNEDKNYNIDSVRNDLQNYGDSLIVVGSDNTLKIHIHSNHPGVVIEHSLKLGDLVDITIENMKLQNQEYVKKEAYNEKRNQVNNIMEVNENDIQNNFGNHPDSP